MCLLNLLWLLFGGLIMCFSWMLAGLLWCVTIVGIPVGTQCFKIGLLCLWPFGRNVIPGGGTGSFLLNLLWVCFSGLPLAIEASAMGLACCATIIGIPFGMQYFKIARLAFTPFGTIVV